MLSLPTEARLQLSYSWFLIATCRPETKVMLGFGVGGGDMPWCQANPSLAGLVLSEVQQDLKSEAVLQLGSWIASVI